MSQYYENNQSCDLYRITIGITALIKENRILSQFEPWESNFQVVTEDDVHYPESLHIELTSKCNLRCFYCYRESEIDTEDVNPLTIEELKKIIISLSECGLKVAEITGGEPLLYPYIIEIIDLCYSNLSMTSIITNGTLINENFISKILPYKSKTLFSISLDSHIEEEHDRRSGVKGSFRKATNGIKLLAKSGFIVRTAMAIDENNWSHVEDTIIFSKKIGASKFAYSPILPFGRAEDNISLFKNKTAEEILKQERYLSEKYPDFIHYLDEKRAEQLFNKSNCGAGHTSYVMNPAGDVRICATFGENEGVIGSLKHTHHSEVFKSDACILSAKISPPKPSICGDCEHLIFCIGCSLRGAKRVSIIGEEHCVWAKDNSVKKWLSLVYLS